MDGEYESSPVLSCPAKHRGIPAHSLGPQPTHRAQSPPWPLPNWPMQMPAPLTFAAASSLQLKPRALGIPWSARPSPARPARAHGSVRRACRGRRLGKNRHVCSGSPGRNARHSCSPVGIGLEFVLARLAGGWMPLCRLGRPVALRRRPSGEIFSLDGAPVQRDAEASLCCYRLVYGWSCLACFLGGEFQTGDQTTG